MAIMIFAPDHIRCRARVQLPAALETDSSGIQLAARRNGRQAWNRSAPRNNGGRDAQRNLTNGRLELLMIRVLGWKVVFTGPPPDL
jgi:hypothetical protein